MEKILKKLIKKDSNKDDLKGKLLFKKYKIINKIGKGSFGFVYSGENIQNKQKIAIKFEKKDSSYHLLQNEGMLLALLKGPGIPEIISFGKNKVYYILIQELLGDNLWQVIKKRNLRKYDINDLSKIAIQIIDRIEYVHSKNILHRDIKPENFLLGLDNKNYIYIIDFGISRKYRSDKTGKHIRYTLTGKLFGTLKFISYNAARGVEHSRRDDMLSIGHMLAFLAGNKLPWQGYEIHGPNAKRNYEKVVELKRISKPEDICRGLPEEFAEYIKYCKGLNFEQEPDYEKLRNLFKQVLIKNNKDIFSEFSFNQKINVIKYLNYKTKGKNDDLSTISKEKYINILRRKKSPQMNLFHQIENKLNNLKIISADQTVNKNVKDEINNLSKHQKGACSFISTHSSNSRDGHSNDSVQVQYNVDIADIKDEAKSNNNIKASLVENNDISIGNSTSNEIKKNDIFQNINYDLKKNTEKKKGLIIQKYNKKINKKNFNISIDLDSKFIFNGINFEIKKKYNSQSPKNQAKYKHKKVFNEENKRRNICKNIYMNIIKKFGFNKETPKSNYINNKNIHKNKLNIIPLKNNNIKNIYQANNKANYNIIKNIDLISSKNNNYQQLSNANNLNYPINNNNNIIINKDTFGINNKKPQKIINIERKREVNKDYINILKINNESRADDFNQISDKKIIIINNNINSFNNSNEKNQYHRIIDEKNNPIQNIKRKKYVARKKVIIPIINDNSKMLKTDNYINISRNNTNQNNMSNRKITNNNKGFSYAPTFNNNYYDSTLKNDYNMININDKKIIRMPNTKMFNRSNDDIINRNAIKKIRIHNYKSMFNRDKIQNSKFSIKIQSYVLANKYLGNSPEPRKKSDIMKLNTSPISSEGKIKNYITQMINQTNNNIINKQSYNSPTQFLSMDNKSINPNVLNYQQNYGNINYDNNKYNLLSKYNTNKLLESRSNNNILERRLNAAKKKNNIYHHDGNASDDIRSYEKNKKNNPINNNPHEQKFVYSINKYNNLYSYN